jgi:hypothetical protein
MPGVLPRGASDVKFQSRFDGPATNPGVAAATAVCDALVKKNVASVEDLRLLMPVFQTILHPDYLSALRSGHVQIPIIPQISAVMTARSSSPDSVILGSQILNTRRDAQEIQARLNAAHWSNKHERRDDDSTSGSSNEGPSRTLSCQLQKCRSNQKKRKSHQSSSSECESPNPHQHRRHRKAKRSNDNHSLSDGAQSQTHHSSQAPEDSKVPLPWSGVDGYLPPVPQGAQSDTTYEW